MNSNAQLLVVVLGTLMAAVDTTIVVLALPVIASSLHADLALVIWTLLAYLLTTAVLATQMGRVGDILGRSKVYNTGFVIFTISSALCGISPDVYALIGFRILQGIGGSMLIGNSSAIISDVFPREIRGRAFGFTALGWNSGATLGIVLGGILTTFLGWQWIFYINVPIGFLAVILGVRTLKDTNKNQAKLDVVGGVLLGASLSLISFGAVEMAGNGLTLYSLSFMIVGASLLIPFVFYELRSDHPMLQLRAFRERILTYSIVASFLQSMGYLSVVFLLIMYLQGVKGLSPFYASLLLVPGYVLSSLISPYMGRLADRLGSRIMATSGIFMMLVAMGIYLTLTVSSPLFVVVIASIISGVGASMFYPANNSSIMRNAPRQFYGAISGLARTLGNIGTLASYVISITVASLSVSRETAYEVFLGTTNLQGGVSVSFVHGIHEAFLTSIGILVLALVISALRGSETQVRDRRMEGAPLGPLTKK